MTAKTFLQWGISIASVAIALIAIYAVGEDIYLARFPRLEAILGIRDGRLEMLLIAVLAVCVATFVIFIFGATKGNLEFSALGIQIKGPAGPALLWTIVFVATIASINYVANDYSKNRTSVGMSQRELLDAAINLCSGNDPKVFAEMTEIQAKSLDDLQGRIKSDIDLAIYRAYIECIQTTVVKLGGKPLPTQGDSGAPTD